MATKLQRLRDNIAAIKFLLTQEGRNSNITDKYTGFGGLNFVLNPLDTGAWTKSDLDCFCDTIMLHQVLNDNSKDEREYKAWMQSLKASTLTAFYTPKEVAHAIIGAIYGEEFVSLGFTTATRHKKDWMKPKTILDPAAGGGVFMQAVCRQNVALTQFDYKMTAYENDKLTGLLLKRQWGEGTDIRIAGFETIPAADLGRFDLVATNVPFGDIRVYDKAYTDSKEQVRKDAARMIHRYYVLKGLDCLREGGVLAYIITSNYLNRDTEQVAYALRQARLIGAYRLANNLFKENGTEVGTDLLVLQKESGRGELTHDEEMLLCGYEDGGCPTNLYFTCKPDHVIATQTERDTDAYGKPGFVYYHEDGVSGIAEDMRKVLAEDLHTNLRSEKLKVKSEKSTTAPTEPKEKRKTKKEQALEDVLFVYTDLYIGEQAEQEENKEGRENLNRLYDAFVEAYGKLHDRKNIDVVERVAKELKGLELKDADGTWQKADIMLRPIAFATAEETEERTYTAQEALTQSLNDYGRPVIGYMAQLAGMDEQAVLTDLDGEVYYNPLTGEYEIKAKFLSGNVVEKLDAIRSIQSNRSIPNNQKAQIETVITALTTAVPTPIPFADLDFNLGERWIDESVYAAFASEFFDVPESKRPTWSRGKLEVKVHYEPTIDQYAVSASHHNEKIWTQFAVKSEASKDLDGMDLLTHALHNTCPKMMKYLRDKNGSRVYNDNYEYIKIEDAEKTQLANTKIEEIRQGFIEWLQRQPQKFRDRLADTYNRRFNCFVKPQYDGSHQTFPGVDWAGLRAKYGIESVYQSQKDCVWMLVMNGGGICDHEVGSGKTLIMCLAAHEMKRLGLVHKPMIIGLKANVGAIAETYRTAYPQAKVLYATAKDYSASNRTDFFNQMKNNDWDCVIMSHDQFSRIPQSDEMQQQVVMDELDECEAALDVLSEQGYEISSKMRKGLEQRKRNLSAKLEKLQDVMSERADDIVDFEQMGIDHIFVDESHAFKNLGFTTRHSRVAGLGNNTGSQRAFNLLMAIRTIQQRTGRDLGATFLSGTTVTNSLTELYCLFKYLRPQAMQQQRITCFDAWAAIFTRKSSEFEFSITNSIIIKERFRYFIKVPELANFYNEITDYRTAEDVGIERPQRNTRLLNLKPTRQQERYIKTLMEFAETGNFSLIGIDNPNDNQRKAKMLYATDQARKMSLDMRLIDPLYGDDPGNKASQCAKQIADYYRRYDEQKGTQLVFSDLSAYDKTKWNIYSEIKRKLMEDYGIPASEIRFIQEAQSEKAKQRLIDEVNAGRVRVLFGSTTMLGTGVNAQQRVVAVHHLDTPWRPADLEQRDGRAIRKGNEIARLYADNRVDILIYAVERSLDSYKFNLLNTKQTFISQLKRGQLGIRTLDEGAMDQETGMNFAEYMAVLSGNTDLLERAKMERRIAALEGEKKNFLREQTEQQQRIVALTADTERHERNVSEAKSDLARFEKAMRHDAQGNVLNDLVLDGCSVPSDVIAGSDEWVKAIGKHLLHLADTIRTAPGNYETIGTICGFPIYVRTDQTGTLDDKPIYTNLFFVKGNMILYKFETGTLRNSHRYAADYFINALERIPAVIKQWTDRIAEDKASIDQLHSMLTQTWSKEATLRDLRSELAKLDRRIASDLAQRDEAQKMKQAA